MEGPSDGRSGMATLAPSSGSPSTACVPSVAGRHAHFVGVGGCGMSGLARLVHAEGARCTGSDRSHGERIAALERAGIDVSTRQTADTLPPTADLVVVSAAIPRDHPEVTEARRRGLPVVKYAQLLGSLMAGRTGLAVAGTHGKSTTSAMVAHALIRAGCDPSFVIGAASEQIGGGARVAAAADPVVLAEACEYDRSFHNLNPTHAAILNVEPDHLEVYGTADEVERAFNGFARRTAADGSLVVEHGAATRGSVTDQVRCRVETIGFDRAADWQVDRRQDNGKQHVSVAWRGRPVTRFACRLPGAHTAYNAATAAVLAHRAGAGWDAAADALSDFAGVERRMQLVGRANGAPVVDDYAHHPTEVAATLAALRSHYLGDRGEGRLHCVFQPHQHVRTRFLLDRFGSCFTAADTVLVPPIYTARDSEEDRRAVTAADLVARLRRNGQIARTVEDLHEPVDRLRSEVRPEDLVVVMGAGPVWEIAHALVEPQASQSPEGTPPAA